MIKMAMMMMMIMILPYSVVTFSNGPGTGSTSCKLINSPDGSLTSYYSSDVLPTNMGNYDGTQTNTETSTNFILESSQSTYNTGDSITITLRPTEVNVKFKGYLVDVTSGNWDSSVSRRSGCVESTATHTDSNDKSQVSFTWLASSDEKAIFQAIILSSGTFFLTGKLELTLIEVPSTTPTITTTTTTEAPVITTTTTTEAPVITTTTTTEAPVINTTTENSVTTTSQSTTSQSEVFSTQSSTSTTTTTINSSTTSAAESITSTQSSPSTTDSSSEIITTQSYTITTTMELTNSTTQSSSDDDDDNLFGFERKYIFIAACFFLGTILVFCSCLVLYFSCCKGFSSSSSSSYYSDSGISLRRVSKHQKKVQRGHVEHYVKTRLQEPYAMY